MTQPRITLMWRHLDPYELGKDVVLLPWYLAEALDANVHIVCNSESVPVLPENISRRISLEQQPLGFKPRQRVPVNVRYLLKNGRDIDILLLFHWRPESLINILVYKYCNHNGKVYLKMDTVDGSEFRAFFSKGLASALKKALYRRCLGLTDVISCESEQVYRKILPVLGNKLIFLPNGFDEQGYKSLERNAAPKEKLFITVGRLGTHQKNTEMILEALDGIDLKDWKFRFIGRIEESFKAKADEFFKKNPDKIESVRFIGEVLDKSELWGWYERASAFVLSSRWESYGLVLDEAARFSDYIISTPAGAAETVTKNFPGEIVATAGQLRIAIERVIDGTTDLPSGLSEEQIRSLSWEYRIKELAQKLNQ